MEKVFTGSRLADGNKIVPPEITLKDDCVIVKEAGMNGKLITVSYDNILRLQMRAPLIGFSSIKFGYVGANVVIKTTFSKKETADAVGEVEINGFSKSEANEIKRIIENEGFGFDDDDDDDDDENDDDENESKHQGRVPDAEVRPVTTPITAVAQTASALEGLYDARLEKLIEAALADGELTEKEKQILFRNAAAQGIDLDEFEMVLEARLHEKKKK